MIHLCYSEIYDSLLQIYLFVIENQIKNLIEITQFGIQKFHENRLSSYLSTSSKQTHVSTSMYSVVRN